MKHPKTLGTGLLTFFGFYICFYLCFLHYIYFVRFKILFSPLSRLQVSVIVLLIFFYELTVIFFKIIKSSLHPLNYQINCRQTWDNEKVDLSIFFSLSVRLNPLVTYNFLIVAIHNIFAKNWVKIFSTCYLKSQVTYIYA